MILLVVTLHFSPLLLPKDILQREITLREHDLATLRRQERFLRP